MEALQYPSSAADLAQAVFSLLFLSNKLETECPLIIMAWLHTST